MFQRPVYVSITRATAIAGSVLKRYESRWVPVSMQAQRAREAAKKAATLAP